MAVIGDSCVYGLGLRAADTIPVRLERYLGEVLGRPVVVLNFGVPGYSTVQIDRMVEVLARRTAPRSRPAPRVSRFRGNGAAPEGAPKDPAR